jgi:hypothetical protein
MENNYGNIIKTALKLGTKPKVIKEGKIPYNGKERMHSEIEQELREGKTSLGNSSIIPEGDEMSFMERIMGERFNRVANNYKRAFDVDEVDENQVKANMSKLVNETMKMESSCKKELVEIAINMVREEFDMS